jgi:hypothetical protein
VLVITWFAGFGMFLDTLAGKADDRFPLLFAAVMAVVVGPLLTFTIVFLSSFFSTWTGRLLGGRGSNLDIRAALAWAQAPLLLYLFLWIPLPGMGPFKLVVDMLGIAIILWSEALAVVLLAQVHGFSVLRGLAAMLLAWILKLVLVVGLVLGLASRLAGPPPKTAAPAQREMTE